MFKMLLFLAVGNCIEGVSIGDDNNKATWRIDFNSDATIEQRTSCTSCFKFIRL